MKFDWKEGLIWVNIDVVYDGTSYQIERCLVDTGSATTAIDIDAVAFDFQKPAVITRLCGIGGGTQEVVEQTIDGLTIDTHRISNVAIEFGNLRSDMGINGFIGNDILSAFTVKIDYSKQEIEWMR